MNSEIAQAEITAMKPKSRNFHLLVINSSVSSAGLSGFSLAIIWITLVITKSTVLSGLADGMSALPLFLSFVFGAYVDSIASKKNLAILVSVGRVASMFGLFIALHYNNLILEVVSIYSVAFVLGLTTDVMDSISSAWTKQFLTEDTYKKGTSSLRSATSLAQGAGYAISGGIILLGIAPAIVGFAVIFGVSTIPLFVVKNDRTTEVSEDSGLHSSMINGIRYIFHDSRLKAMILITLVVNLAFGMVAIFFAVLVEQSFSLPAIYFTTLYFSLTAGIFVGSVLGGKVSGKLGFYTVLTVSIIGALVFLVGFISSIFLDYPVSFLMGLVIGVINVLVMAALVKFVDQTMMARVMGALKTFAISLTFISGAVGGLIITLIGVSNAFYLIGTVIFIAAFIPLAFRDYYNARA